MRVSNGFPLGCSLLLPVGTVVRVQTLKVNGILFGELVNDTTATQGGYTLLADWLAYAATADIHEFSSPTYYWVQLNAVDVDCPTPPRAPDKTVPMFY
jgi:hypothetical protein